MENPRWLTEETRTHAQALSQAMDDELRVRPTPPKRFERVFDDGTFMLLRTSCDARGKAPAEPFELRFSEKNARPDPSALVHMGVALAHLRGVPMLIADERETPHVSVSFTAYPHHAPEALLSRYEHERAAFMGAALMHHAQVDVLVGKFRNLPQHRVVHEAADGPIHEYRLTFSRPMPLEKLAAIAATIAGWCNQADAGTHEQMQQLRDMFHARRHPHEPQVTVGPEHASTDTLTLMVPESFGYSSMALTALCEQALHRRV